MSTVFTQIKCDGLGCGMHTTLEKAAEDGWLHNEPDLLRRWGNDFCPQHKPWETVSRLEVIVVCPTCGAAVVDSATHQGWHDR